MNPLLNLNDTFTGAVISTFGSTGGNVPMNNMSPYLALNYVIKL